MARDCRRRIRLVLVHGPSSCPGKEMTLPAAPDDNHPPAAASIESRAFVSSVSRTARRSASPSLTSAVVSTHPGLRPLSHSL